MNNSLRTAICMSFIFSGFSAFAQSQISAAQKAEFCKRETDTTIVQQLALQPENITGFDNGGGLFSGKGLLQNGTCWWHSRLQRSALYLTVFRPDLAAPQTDEEVHEIYRALRANNRVVEIGGFRNWQEFTTRYADLLQTYLNHWMTEETFVKQSWFNGVLNRGRPDGEKAAARLEKLMQDVVEEVVDHHRITYVKLSMKFPTAHSWLILEAKKLPDGIDLTVLDSNFSAKSSDFYGSYVYHYHFGDEALSADHIQVKMSPYLVEAYGKFAPFVQHEGDFKSIERAIHRYCSATE